MSFDPVSVYLQCGDGVHIVQPPLYLLPDDAQLDEGEVTFVGNIVTDVTAGVAVGSLIRLVVAAMCSILNGQRQIVGEMVLDVVGGPLACEQEALEVDRGSSGDIPVDNNFAPLFSEGAYKLEEDGGDAHSFGKIVLSGEDDVPRALSLSQDLGASARLHGVVGEQGGVASCHDVR